MKTDPSSRGKSQLRTLDSMKRNLDNFEEAGKNIKNAKLFKNVIAEPIFKIPLDQVRPAYHQYTLYKFTSVLEIRKITIGISYIYIFVPIHSVLTI